MTSAEIPPGFERHFRQSPLTDPWEPIYSKRTAEAVIIGLWLSNAHTNSRSFVHGGLIATLADNAMGLSCVVKANAQISPVTISLGVDYLGTANPGQWLEIVTNFVQIGASVCFAQCLVTADGVPCARANATFKVMRKRED